MSALVPLQAFSAQISAEAFLVARLLFGAVLAFMGLNHFMNAEAMAGYAGAKGIPAPKLAVTVSGGMLIFGGLGVAAGVATTLAAGALVTFFLVATPKMHDFWNAPEEEQQNEMTQFLKNTAMLGASLGLLGLSTVAWPYALNAGLL